MWFVFGLVQSLVGLGNGFRTGECKKWCALPRQIVDKIVEVPQTQEIIRHVPKVEVQEVEVKVVKIEIQTVDKEVGREEIASERSNLPIAITRHWIKRSKVRTRDQGLDSDACVQNTSTFTEPFTNDYGTASRSFVMASRVP